MFMLLLITLLAFEYRNCANFGLHDSYDCNCVNDEQCEKDTGSCVNGCSGKWSGPSCQKQCNVGTYGSDCSNFCYCFDNVGCSDNGVCPKGCRNGWQGPNCNIEIAPNNFLISTDTQEKAIIRLDLTSRGHMTLPITNHNNPIAIDFDLKESRIYWTDVSSKQIRGASLAGDSDTLIRQLNNVSIPDGIAVDSLNRLIFYTDTGNNLIAKMTVNGSSHLEIIKTGLDEPRAIVLDTTNKKIYWTDWGQNANIMTADYDGKNQKSLITTGLMWPNGLALDFKNNRMFWTDAGTKKIETATIEGSSRRTILYSNTAHYFGIAYHENVLYYTDWNRKSVMKLRIDGTAARLESFGPAVFGRLNDIHLYVYQGDEYQCHNNTYGAGCIKQCNNRNCDGSSDCNAITGECQNGCKPGYKGQDCTSECNQGFYGPDCAFNCASRHCTDQSDCNSRDGACKCTNGYEGVDCTVKKTGQIGGPSKQGEINPTWIIVGTILGLGIGICIGVGGTMLVYKHRASKNKGKIVYNPSTGHINLYNNNDVTNPQSSTTDTENRDNRDSGNYDRLSPYINDQPYAKF